MDFDAEQISRVITKIQWPSWNCKEQKLWVWQVETVTLKL